MVLLSQIPLNIPSPTYPLSTLVSLLLQDHFDDDPEERGMAVQASWDGGWDGGGGAIPYPYALLDSLSPLHSISLTPTAHPINVSMSTYGAIATYVTIFTSVLPKTMVCLLELSGLES